MSVDPSQMGVPPAGMAPQAPAQPQAPPLQPAVPDPTGELLRAIEAAAKAGQMAERTGEEMERYGNAAYKFAQALEIAMKPPEQLTTPQEAPNATQP